MKTPEEEALLLKACLIQASRAILYAFKCTFRKLHRPMFVATPPPYKTHRICTNPIGAVGEGRAEALTMASTTTSPRPVCAGVVSVAINCGDVVHTSRSVVPLSVYVAIVRLPTIKPGFHYPS